MQRRLYSLLTWLAVPAAYGWMLWRGFKERGYWQHLGERLGFGPAVDGDSIWVHAVSMGEVAAAAPLVRALRLRYPTTPLVITTATPTGRARAQALFKDVTVRFIAFDTAGAVKRLIRRLKPRILVIMETELWPNLLEGCRRQGVPVLIANARLSPRSVAQYQRFPKIFASVFSDNLLIAARTEVDARRFLEIGASESQVRIVGNIKFDAAVDPDVFRWARETRAWMGAERVVWTAGSTHAGEESQILAAHEALLRQRPDALLVLAPRHPDRFDGVAELIKLRGLRFTRRSTGIPRTPYYGEQSKLADFRVLLLDTIGELIAYYAASEVVFVGGSLVPIGGHNLIEPAALGLPVLTGPSHANAPDVAEAMIEAGAALQVADAAALSTALIRLINDPDERQRIADNGLAIVAANRGTVGRLLELVEVAAPVVELAAPVVEAAAPVVEAAAPVVEVAAPVVEVAGPVVVPAVPVVVSAEPAAMPELSSAIDPPAGSAGSRSLDASQPAGVLDPVSEPEPSAADDVEVTPPARQGSPVI